MFSSVGFFESVCNSAAVSIDSDLLSYFIPLSDNPTTYPSHSPAFSLQQCVDQTSPDDLTIVLDRLSEFVDDMLNTTHSPLKLMGRLYRTLYVPLFLSLKQPAIPPLGRHIIDFGESVVLSSMNDSLHNKLLNSIDKISALQISRLYPLDMAIEEYPAWRELFEELQLPSTVVIRLHRDLLFNSLPDWLVHPHLISEQRSYILDRVRQTVMEQWTIDPLARQSWCIRAFRHGIECYLKSSIPSLKAEDTHESRQSVGNLFDRLRRTLIARHQNNQQVQQRLRSLTLSWIPLSPCLDAPQLYRWHDVNRREHIDAGLPHWFIQAQSIRFQLDIARAPNAVSPYTPTAVYNVLSMEVSLSPAFLSTRVLRVYNTTNLLQTYAGLGFLLVHEMMHGILPFYGLENDEIFQRTVQCFKKSGSNLLKDVTSKDVWIELITDMHAMNFLIEFIKDAASHKPINWRQLFTYFALPWCHLRDETSTPPFAVENPTVATRINAIVQYIYRLETSGQHSKDDIHSCLLF